MKNIKIDPEFQSLIPPLTDEERSQLERNLLSDGCRDPIVVWEGIILDGHNRYEICTRQKIDFNTVPISLPSREAAEDWIDANQLGRRNLSPSDFAMMLGRRYNRMKKANGVRGPEKLDQNDPASTADRLARQHGVSPATVKRAGQFAEAVEKIKPFVPDIEHEIRKPDGPTQRDVIEAAKEPETAPERLKPPRAKGTGENEWYTPKEYIDAARKVMGSIDLDPASCPEANETVQAKTFFTAEDDGLVKEWKGNVWINPPYSTDLMRLFVEKLKKEYQFGTIEAAILVSHNNTETRWFQDLASISGAICFPSTRIRFYRGENLASPVNGQAFFYLGGDRAKFFEVFSEFGLIVEPKHG